MRPFDHIYDTALQIGQVEPCVPEAFCYNVPGAPDDDDDDDPHFTKPGRATKAGHGGDRQYRLVLVGKRGIRGYRSAPVFKVERLAGVDTFGVEAWIDAHETPSALVVALFMALRAAGSSTIRRRSEPPTAAPV